MVGKFSFGVYGSGPPPLNVLICHRTIDFLREPGDSWFSSQKIRPYGEGFHKRLNCTIKMILKTLFNFHSFNGYKDLVITRKSSLFNFVSFGKIPFDRRE